MANLKYVSIPGVSGSLTVCDPVALKETYMTVDGTKVTPTKGFSKKENSDATYTPQLDVVTSSIITPTTTTSTTDSHISLVETMSVDDTTHTLSFTTKMYKTGNAYTVDYE